MIIYYVVFSQIRQNPIPEFWAYIASGIFAFHYMTNCLVSGAGCITGNSGMVKKMYFPREILVLSQSISSFVVMTIGYAIVFLALIVTGYEFDLTVLLTPLVFILLFTFVTGYMLVFSSLTVYVRDVQHLLNSISIAFFFLTPMYFTIESTHGILNTILWLNPFTYYIEALHHIIYYGTIPDWPLAIACVLIALVSLSIGILVFHKMRGGFAERL